MIFSWVWCGRKKYTQTQMINNKWKYDYLQMLNRKNSVIFKYVTVRGTFAQVHWRYVKHHRRSWPGELLSCPVLYNVLMRGHRELCIFVECSLIIVCLILICCRTPPLSVLSARFMWVGHLRLERNTRTLKNINS